MKQMLFVSLLIISGFCLTSCEKNLSQANDNNSISGKWNLVYDSTFTGVGANNHPINYTGQSSDYFDFITDSTIYTRENLVLDTLTYHLTSDNTIVISSFGIIVNGIPDTCLIINDGNSMTIIAPVIITPGGAFGRKVNLRR